MFWAGGRCEVDSVPAQEIWAVAEILPVSEEVRNWDKVLDGELGPGYPTLALAPPLVLAGALVRAVV